MKRRTFLKVGSGVLVGSAMAACGGSDSHGSVEPDPPAAPVRTGVVSGWNEAPLQAVRMTEPGLQRPHARAT